ncbi:MAG: PLP-dependent aminotransferase family protein [Candidatus Omnitrophota bacterium]
MKPIDWKERFSAQGKRTPPPEISWLMAQALEVPGLISLAAGFVDQESLPHAEISPLIAKLMSAPVSGQAALQYGTTLGDLELRQHLLSRMRREGVLHPAAEIDASQILLGSGSQQILYLAAEVLLDEGDIVLLEAPTYFVVLGAMRTRGVRTIGVDVDENGLIPEKVAECLARLEANGEIGRVKMIYAMSYATNPQGVTLSGGRRKRLMEILNDYREKGHPILLLEDAAYRRLVFDDYAPAPIKSHDANNDLVLYTESFSKSLSPGLRLGFCAGPKALIDKMADFKGNHDFGSSNLCQQIIKRILLSGLFDEHTRFLRRRYEHKRDLVWRILQETMPPEAKALKASGGFYTWITLPPSIDTGPESETFRQALKEKVLYVPGSLCYSCDRAESQRCSSLRISFGMIGEEPLQEGCVRLARALSHSAALIA